MDNQDPRLFIPIIDLQSVFFFLQINMTTILKNIRNNIEDVFVYIYLLSCLCLFIYQFKSLPHKFLFIVTLKSINPLWLVNFNSQFLDKHLFIIIL